MNVYKFINAESMKVAITTLLQDEIAKIKFPPRFRETKLTDAWISEYVDDRLVDANEEMDIILHLAYEPSSTAIFRIDVAYNKHINGIEERDDEQYKELVRRIDHEDHHAQTASDLLFINTWYLDTFAKDNIVKPFVSIVKKWSWGYKQCR